MARIKYYYDTETCKYERVKVKKWDVVLNLLGFLTVSLIFAIGIVIVYTSYFESPKEARLSKENEELRFYYEITEKKIDKMSRMLTVLQERDDNVYRTIFEAEPIPNSIRQAGIGGANRYQDLIEKGLEREELIVNAFQRIDKLKKQMYIQTKSYDEIMDLAREKSKMLAAIPSIQPVPKNKLKKVASGYGPRMHPILKVKKMHTGLDFSAPRGTPIYATGDGVVKRTKYSYGGYGRMVIIDHGFGYMTRYAHMHKWVVKRGQKVKRGDLIGYVGNTGRSTGPHLHYEVLKNNEHVNPVYYFFKDVSDEEYQEILRQASVENQSMS